MIDLNFNFPKPYFTLEEFLQCKALGYTRPRCEGQLVRVSYPCKICGKEHTSSFYAMSVRKQKYFDLCTKCAGSLNRSEMNSLRDDNYYSNEDYREKISKGVKSYYKATGKIASDKRCEVRWENFKKNGVPDFSAKRVMIGELNCASYGEGVFVEWKLSQGYKVSKCNFYIEYKLGEEDYHYIPDFLIEKDGITTLIEVKCDFLRNFREKKSEKKLSKNLTTYGLDELYAKIEVAKVYCIEKGWEFELITLDNKRFNLLYNRAKRKRSEDRKKNNSSL